MNESITDTARRLQEAISNTLVSILDPVKDAELIAALNVVKSADIVRQHMTNITKNRTIILTGDTSHLSVQSIIQYLDDIDKPKKYDFQDDDYREQNFLNSLLNCIPSYILHRDVSQEKLMNAIEGKEWLELSESREQNCYDCAQPLKVAFKGNEVHITANTACEQNHTFTIEVDFPTGEVVYADWPARFSEMRDAGFIMEQETESINYIRGQRKRSEEYATQQIVHHSVGNTSPTFYVNKNTHAIQIGGGTYNEKTDEFTGPEGLTNVGSFCTDLWWVTMIDRQFYDIMAAKLPKKRNAKYYTKELVVAHIEPGRYRFTCYGDVGDYSNKPYMVGERIGDASKFVPSYDSDKTLRAMTVDEAISHMARKYIFSMGSDAITPKARFRLMDHTFNVIGNGISSKGDFMSYYGVPNSTVVELLPKDDTAPLDMGFVYPNFTEQYSLLYKMKPADFPTDWLENALWFYNECKTFFLNGAEGYSNAYPNKDKKQDDDFREIINRLGTERTEAEWHSYVSKTYGNGHTEFKGDFHDWRTRSWENEKARIIAFIDKTTALIQKTLDERV